MVMPWPYFDDAFSSRRPQQPPVETNDERLTRLVTERLHQDPRTRRQPITVTVQNRVVILAGSVDSTDAQFAAGDRAWEIPGVFDVCNALSAPRDGAR